MHSATRSRRGCSSAHRWRPRPSAAGQTSTEVSAHPSHGMASHGVVSCRLIARWSRHIPISFSIPRCSFLRGEGVRVRAALRRVSAPARCGAAVPGHSTGQGGSLTIGSAANLTCLYQVLSPSAAASSSSPSPSLYSSRSVREASGYASGLQPILPHPALPYPTLICWLQGVCSTTRPI